MKTKSFVFVLIAAALLIGATSWEGAANVVSSGDLPGGGFCVATNSFPKNTIVDITNLENNKTVRVIVVSGLDSASLLATLSRSAAESIELSQNFVSRVRITQPTDVFSFSRYNTEDEADTEPEVSMNTIDAVIAADVIDENITEIAEAVTEETVTPPAETSDEELSLVPSEERIPDSEERIIAAEDIVPPVEPAAEVQPIEREYVFITVIQPPEEVPAPEPPAAAVFNDFSPFQAPLIRDLEKGKWYVQIGAYTRPDYVEDEISRVGSSYPVAIQNIGSETDPLFRVLLGPLNQGESGAMLQRFKSIGYPDAFVRHN